MDNEVLSTETTQDNSTSDVDTEALVNELLEEPNEDVETNEAPTEEATEAKEEESKDNTHKYPEKFLENGELNVDKLIEAYSNIEKYSSQLTAQRKQEEQELKQLREWAQFQNQQAQQTARNAGYETAQDYQQAKEIAGLEANEYSKYLHYIEDPEERLAVQELLSDYRTNPSKSLLNRIEMEFAPEINKLVGIEAFKKQQQFDNQKQTDAETLKMTNIEGVISEAMQTNRELFDDEAFNTLFVNTLYRYGDNFTIEDANILMSAIKQMQASAVEAYKKSIDVAKDNEKATDKLATITGTNADTNVNKRVGDMTPAEFDRFIEGLI